ncbi:Tetratricopeptide repeat protein 13 [Holothuria leucospilota]|uniref:Tetratricopeptide repeat protein 13 n=1 Tax=Holothuria leucospilota TaxID=206669 RepID=A0A9Q1HFZ3_HOLLE|nr:Tetratricopeptide repeat protein 13 [Holothuria leucospilota]
MAVPTLVVVVLATLVQFPSKATVLGQLQGGVSMRCIRTDDLPGITQSQHVLMSGGFHVTIEGTLVCTPVDAEPGTIESSLNDELAKLINIEEERQDSLATEDGISDPLYEDGIATDLTLEEFQCNCKHKEKLFENLVALTETSLNLDVLNSCGITLGPSMETKQTSQKLFVVDDEEEEVSYSDSSYSSHFDQEEASAFASMLVANGFLPFPSSDEHFNYVLAYSLVLMNVGQSHEAVQQLSILIKQHPNLPGAYHARGAAYTRLGLQDKENVAHALKDFSRAIELDRQSPLGWEQRGELNILLGRTSKAMADITHALDLRPSAKLFLLRAGLFLKERKLSLAVNDFFNSLRIDTNQPDAFHLLGVSFFHQGKLHEATRSIKHAIRMNPNCLECMQNLGQIYKELGKYEESLEILNAALELDWNNSQTLHLRGLLYVDSGNIKGAYEDFKTCADLEPSHQVCSIMVAMCLMITGQFYEAVKTSARVMTLSLSDNHAHLHDRAMYIKEISRYMHAHLDSPMFELNMDVDLSPNFKAGWVRIDDFPIEDYLEQPGIMPDISDVDLLGFSDFEPEVQSLICKSILLGRLGEHSTDGFLPNDRQNLAMGLASIEVAQTVKQFWKSPRSYRNHFGKRFGWKDVYDISVKWIRACNPDKPIFWLDHMPEHCTQNACETFNYQIILLHGQTYNIRYESYLDGVLNATKRLLTQYLQESSDEDRYLNLDDIKNLEVLLNLMRKLKDVGPGFIISNRISSHQKLAEKLEGVSFELQEEKPGNLMFSMTSFTSKRRTEQFHAEMDHVWHALSEEMQNFKKSVNSPREGDFESVGNLIVTLMYYFYNLMPLTSGPSSVAYSVAIGLFIATGREVTSSIPKGRIVEMEAMLATTPSAFTTVVKQWMNLQKSHSSISNLPLVAETFPSLRSMLEVLNTGAIVCKY